MSNGIFNRNLLLLLQGHFVSKIGTALFDVALVLWLKQQTDMASLIGLILMLSNIPEIILSPFSGTVVDLVSRKKVLIITDLIIGFIIIGIGIVVNYCADNRVLSISMLMAGSVFIGICGSFFFPAVSSFIPELVEKKKLQKVNSIYQLSSNCAAFIGQSVAGLLFTILGAPVLFIANGISYIFSALTEMFIDNGTSKISEKKLNDPLKTILINFREGLSYIWNKQSLKRFLFILCLYHFFISPFTVILPFYVSDYLNNSQVWYGYILASLGVGLLLGFIISGFMKFSGMKQSILILACLSISSIGYLLLGFCRNTFSTLIIIFLIGVAIANIVVNLNTIIQVSTPNSMHGRIFGLYNTFSSASIPIGMGFFGVALDFLRRNIADTSKGAAYIFIFCGIVLCVISGYFILKQIFGKSLLQLE